MDSSIKPLRKEILELIASSETITECVFPPMCIAAIYQQQILLLILSKCLTIRAWGSVPANLPCPARFALLNSPQAAWSSHSSTGERKLFCKLHQDRTTNSGQRKMLPKTRGIMRPPFKAAGRNRGIHSTSCILSMGEQRFGKHMVLNQSCFYSL